MRSKNFRIIFVLIFIFLAPGFLAYIFYLNPQWLGTKTINKGQLLNPPIFYPIEKNSSPLADLLITPGKIKLTNKQTWKLIIWQEKNCGKKCIKQLNKVAQLHLALGRNFYNLKTVLVMGPETKILESELLQNLQQKSIAVRQINSLENIPKPWQKTQNGIFLANPAGYLVLSYNLPVRSDDIYHDLKHLLQ